MENICHVTEITIHFKASFLQATSFEISAEEPPVLPKYFCMRNFGVIREFIVLVSSELRDKHLHMPSS